MRLVEAVFWSKILLRFVIITFLGIIALSFLWAGLQKPVPLQNVFIPDNACGVLPKLNFNYINVDYSNATVDLTVQKEIYQDLPPIAYVYKVNLQGETFTTKEKAFRVAEIFKFKPNNYTKPKETLYEWRDNRRVLQFDTRTLNFHYTLLPVAMPPVPNPDIPSIPDAKSIATAFFSNIEDVSNSKIYTFQVDLLPNNGDVEVDSLEQARAIRVDFQKQITALRYPTFLLDSKYRKKHSGEKIDFEQYYNLNNGEDTTAYNTNTVAEAPFLGGSQVYVISKLGQDVENIGRLNYTNWKLEKKPCGTYSIISPEDAFNIVQSKKARVVYMYLWGQDRLKPVKSGILTKLTIFNIYLAYYQPTNLLQYLQPIYVLEGDGRLSTGERVSVFFYIPAVKNL